MGRCQPSAETLKKPLHEASVGFMLLTPQDSSHGGVRALRRIEVGGGHCVTEITVEVEGFPPAKSEALSLLGAGHSHAGRVEKLLAAARSRLAQPGFQPFTGPVGLEATIVAPEDVDPWDATNYLGGIADVLQDKTHLKNHKRMRIALPETLMAVTVYLHDRQVRELQYRQEGGPAPRYRVRIWSL